MHPVAWLPEITDRTESKGTASGSKATSKKSRKSN